MEPSFLSRVRVRPPRYDGFPCGRAAASLQAVEDGARRFAAQPGATVVVDGFDPP